MNKDTVFSGYPLYLSNIPTNGKARVCSRIVENSSRPERCKHLAAVGCSAWWFPAYVEVFLLVGMIGFSLHIGWIEDALFSFGYPYFGTVFFRCRGAAVRVEHDREPDGENRLDGLRNTGSDPAVVVR